MEIKKLSNIDLLALIRTVSLELENRECGVTKYVARKLKTFNQQRAELIQRAREFVKDWATKNRNSWKYKNKNFPNGLWFVDTDENSPTIKVEFHVNAEKRTVVALIKDLRHDGLRSKGIAKCMPDDVFNADIGKAIALARALETDIPQEFMQAVQPDEKLVKGTVIQTVTGQLYELIGQTPEPLRPGETIFDDTKAEYDFESVGESK